MRAVAFLLAMDSALVLGFITPSFVSISATDALVIIFLTMITLIVGVILQAISADRSQIQKMALTQRIGNGIVLLSVLGFFLGMGIIFGITQAEKTYIPIISWFFPSVFLTGIQLFLLCMMLFLGLTLWALVHDLTKKKKLMEKSKA